MGHHLKLLFCCFLSCTDKRVGDFEKQEVIGIGRQDLRFGWHAYLDGITKLRLIQILKIIILYVPC